MPHYKDASNNLYFLDDEKFADVLPPGCTPITDEEAAALRAPTHDQITQARLAEIDKLLSEIDAKGARPSRDIAGALAAGQPAPAAAVKKLADLESQASPLRQERRDLTA